MGTKSVTKSGWTCQTWSSDSPQSHRYNDPEDDSMYPDGSATAAKYDVIFVEPSQLLLVGWGVLRSSNPPPTKPSSPCKVLSAYFV